MIFWNSAGGFRIHMRRHVCFIFFVLLLFLFCLSGEQSTEWIELKFSLKIGRYPSTGVLQISCVTRFVKSLLCSTRKSTSDSTVITIVALLVFFTSQKRVSGGFLGQVFFSWENNISGCVSALKNPTRRMYLALKNKN